MAYCPNCGADVTGDAATCGSCGVSLEQREPVGQTGSSSTSRRQLLSYGAVGAAVVGGGAGAYTLLGGSGPGKGPAGTVRAYVGAIGNENDQRAQRLVHESSSLTGDGFRGPPSSFQNELTVEEARVVEETSGAADVETRITWQIAGRTQTLRLTFELRTEDGAWRIYSIRATGVEERVSGPGY